MDIRKLIIELLGGYTEQMTASVSLDSIRTMISLLGKDKTDSEQCALWYEIEKMAFNELGEVMIQTWIATPEMVRSTILKKYPTLTDLKCPDGAYTVTDLPGMQKILTRDWTNLVPYLLDESDCDKFANRLYEHCCRYYNLNTVFDVWGDSPMGYHAFNVAVLQDGDGCIARLVEPQSDNIFEYESPSGLYIPKECANKLGTLK
jgi:hypothetical protein